VILVSYINKLRLEGKNVREATLEASLLSLAPDHDDGAGRVPRAFSPPQCPPESAATRRNRSRSSSSQGFSPGCFSDSFVNPVLYELVARDGDVLQV